MSKTIPLIVIIFIGIAAFFFLRGERFDLPRGETVPLKEEAKSEKEINKKAAQRSTRSIFVTDGTKHSVPLNEILSGGPGKDGIPAIDNPQFVSVKEADAFVGDEEAGLGIVREGEARFYPYQILVWHEVVNDTIQGDPLLITYCPLCATGIVFERRVSGEIQEFGVSGKLWQSNLLMYNRTGDPETESLWSQVLGEAVLGPETGARLTILPADTVRFGDWKKEYPDTRVLSRKTGSVRSYGIDPYGDYYTSRSVSFGASFNDDRLHPKAYVLGIEVNGRYKAYDNEVLPKGTTADTFAGKTITIEKSGIGEVRISIDGAPLPYIGSFWFSWLAVHPDTDLYK